MGVGRGGGGTSTEQEVGGRRSSPLLGLDPSTHLSGPSAPGSRAFRAGLPRAPRGLQFVGSRLWAL